MEKSQAVEKPAIELEQDVIDPLKEDNEGEKKIKTEPGVEKAEVRGNPDFLKEVHIDLVGPTVEGVEGHTGRGYKVLD